MIPPRFDLLAPHYHWMEAVSFGRRLHQCRTSMLDRMTTRRRALVLGDGDGRFLAELLRVTSEVRIDAIDGSRAMTITAEARVNAVPDGLERVRFTTTDVMTASLPPAHYDLIVSHFFLDCFTAQQLYTLIPRVAAALAHGGEWVVGDFRLPKHGLARLLGVFTLFGMYTFFRCVTGIPAGRLIDPEPLFSDCGLRRTAKWETESGFLACSAWGKSIGRSRTE